MKISTILIVLSQAVYANVFTAFSNPLYLKNLYVFRSSPKIIRSCRFSEEKDTELHYRELMMLYTPWKTEVELKNGLNGEDFSTFQEAYYSWKVEIDPIYNDYNGFNKVVDKSILENGENNIEDEDDLVNIAVTGTTSADANIVNDWEREEMEKYQFQPFYIEAAAFLPETDEKYDIAKDLGMHINQDQGMGAVTVKQQCKTAQEIDIMTRKLNHQQRIFVSNILMRVEAEKESEFIFLTGGPGVGKSEVLKVIDFGMDAIFSKIPGENKC
jgi:hypothetical protein